MSLSAPDFVRIRTTTRGSKIRTPVLETSDESDPAGGGEEGGASGSGSCCQHVGDYAMRMHLDIPVTAELEQRFWSRVQRDEETGCLYWMGALSSGGYGTMSYAGKNYKAHRVAWCLHAQVPNRPEGYVTDHLCRVPPCVEWSHLEAVPNSVNVLRGAAPDIVRAHSVKTHCPLGHALVGKNLMLEPQKQGRWVHRTCRSCHNARHLLSYHLRRARRESGC